MKTVMSRLKPSTILIGSFALFVAMYSVILWPKWVKTVKYSAYFFMQKQIDKDSWRPMEDVVDYLSKKGIEGGKLYSDIFFAERVKFQYPPTSMIPFYVIFKVTDQYLTVLNYISWISTFIMIFFVILIFNGFQANRFTKTTPSRWQISLNEAVVMLSMCFLSLLFYPIMQSYCLGQIQAWINAMFVILFYCWIRNWQVPAGLLLGLLCLIKPQYSLIVLWGILRKKWQFILSFVGIFLIGLFLSFYLFGVKNHFDYFSVLSFLSKHGEAYYPNQSMNGILNRLLLNGNILDWQSHIFPPYHAIVYGGSMIFSAALLLSAFVFPVLAKKQGTVIDLAIISIATTMASPIAWEHHYGILLPIYAFVIAYLFRRDLAGRQDRLYLSIVGISYLMTSSFIPGLNVLAYQPGWNILLSHIFFGALLLLGLLFILLFNADSSLPLNAKADDMGAR